MLAQGFSKLVRRPRERSDEWANIYAWELHSIKAHDALLKHVDERCKAAIVLCNELRCQLIAPARTLFLVAHRAAFLFKRPPPAVAECASHVMLTCRGYRCQYCVGSGFGCSFAVASMPRNRATYLHYQEGVDFILGNQFLQAVQYLYNAWLPSLSVIFGYFHAAEAMRVL